VKGELKVHLSARLSHKLNLIVSAQAERRAETGLFRPLFRRAETITIRWRGKVCGNSQFQDDPGVDPQVNPQIDPLTLTH
jgi:hypothetical protein